MPESLDEFKFGQIPPPTQELHVSALQRLKKLMYNAVNTLAPLFLIGSSSFLQGRGTTIKSWTSSKFDQIGHWTAELATLERLLHFCREGEQP